METIMQTFSATDAKQSFAAIIDTAQRQPVMIRRQKRNIAVVMSVEEYERLTKLRTDEFQHFCDMVGEKAIKQGLTEEKLSTLLSDA
jgi:prevent-host-death family protein